MPQPGGQDQGPQLTRGGRVRPVARQHQDLTSGGRTDPFQEGQGQLQGGEWSQKGCTEDQEPTGQRPAADQFLFWEEDGSSQTEDRIKTSVQQEKYEKISWEERISSQWVDRIETIPRKDEMLAQYSATQEKWVDSRVDRMHTKIKIPQAKDQQQISSWEEDGPSQG